MPDADPSRLPNDASVVASLLVVLVALTNVFMAAHMPAQRLILAEVVGDEESLVARANAYLDGAQTATPLVGPALAGVLIPGGRQSLLPVQVPFLLPAHVLLPVRHRQSL